MGLPAPDDVVYLEVPVSVSLSLIDKRGNKKDIHELDVSFLENSYEAAQFCAKKLGWKKISCVKNGTLRSIDEIFEDIKRELSL